MDVALSTSEPFEKGRASATVYIPGGSRDTRDGARRQTIYLISVDHRLCALPRIRPGFPGQYLCPVR